MIYNEETKTAAFGHEYQGAVDTCGGWLVVKCTRFEAENISRALQRAVNAGKKERSAELCRLLGVR